MSAWAEMLQRRYEIRRRAWRRKHPLVEAKAWTPPEDHPRYAEFRDREAAE
jgi:hypothetical protein